MGKKLFIGNFLVYFLVMIFSLTFMCQSAFSSGVVHLKASAGDNDDYPAVMGLNKFAELVDARTNGQVKIDVYSKGTLYGDQREEVEAVKNQTIAFSLPQVSVLSSWDPKVDFFSMPYLFSGTEHAERVIDSNTGKKIFADLAQYDLVVLSSFTAGGMRSFYNSLRPIKSAADMKGMTLRTTSSPLFIEAIKALGGIPTPISWGELYTALQQKVVDGAEHSPIDVMLYNFDEACQYYSLDEHTYDLIPLVGNTKIIGKLDKKLQDIIYKSAIDAQTWEREYANGQAEGAIVTLEKRGMKINKVDKDSFYKKVISVNKIYAEKLGMDIYNEIVSQR